MDHIYIYIKENTFMPRIPKSNMISETETCDKTDRSMVISRSILFEEKGRTIKRTFGGRGWRRRGGQCKKGTYKRRKLGHRFKGKSNRLPRLTNVTLLSLPERKKETTSL